MAAITEDYGNGTAVKHENATSNKDCFDNDDIKIVSLEELLEFDRKSFSPPLDWPNTNEIDDIMVDDGTPNSIDVKLNRSDEKTPYDPVQENMTPPPLPLMDYLGGQLLICGNRGNEKQFNHNGDCKTVPSFTPMFDFIDKDSDFSSGPPSLSLPDADDVTDDILHSNMYGDMVSNSDDAGIDDWSS